MDILQSCDAFLVVRLSSSPVKVAGLYTSDSGRYRTSVVSVGREKGPAVASLRPGYNPSWAANWRLLSLFISQSSVEAQLRFLWSQSSPYTWRMKVSFTPGF